jgi:hypothetical protein
MGPRQGMDRHEIPCRVKQIYLQLSKQFSFAAGNPGRHAGPAINSLYLGCYQAVWKKQGLPAVEERLNHCLSLLRLHVSTKGRIGDGR